MHSQLKADFVASDENGCPPLLVNFTDLSVVDSNTQYYWDFGNGTFSTQNNPSIVFTASGEYNVRLIISNETESDTIIKMNYIKVYPLPEAKFNISGDTVGCAPFLITFVNTTSYSSEEEVNYTWSFGDGYGSNSESPIHNYLNKGNFDVTLICQNQYSCKDFYSIESAVSVFNPVAGFTVDKNYSCIGELDVKYTNTSTVDDPKEQLWYFGDGITSIEKSPGYHYSNIGVFDVGLVVSDMHGCSDSTGIKNLIEIEHTKANYSVSKDTACQDQLVQFTNTSESFTQFEWKFEDGTSSSESVVGHRFHEFGDHITWLKISNGICSDSIQIPVHVETIVAGFTLSERFLCQLPADVLYQDQSINAKEWDWRFGNGSVSDLRNPVNTINENPDLLVEHYQSYSDTLYVSSEHGCVSKYVLDQSIEIVYPDINISVSDNGNPASLGFCIPKDLMFSDNTTYLTEKDQLKSRKWYRNGTEVSTDQQYSYLFNTSGEQPVDLEVTTEKGCVHKKSLKVEAGEVVEPNFVLSNPYNNCAVDPVLFEITAPDESKISTTVWDFGDEDTSSPPSPPHFYFETGPKDVELTVYNYGCASKIKKENVVNILGPVADFKSVVDCEKPYERLYLASITDADNYFWNFDDETSTVQNVDSVTHQFVARGDYNVKLFTSNQGTGCRYDLSKYTKIREIKADFSFESDKPCPYQPVFLDASVSHDASVFSYNGKSGKYLWQLSNGEEYFVNDILEQTFKSPIELEAILTINDINGCSDTKVKTYKIHRPSVDFNSNYKLGCMPVTFEFLDKTVSDTTITSWFWDFGDTITSNEKNPSHEYLDFGSYDVSLQVTDAFGCTNKRLKKADVDVVFPDASFGTEDSTICQYDSIQFFSTSKSQIEEYNWLFNNEIISDKDLPVVQYTDSGYYSVKLHITDDHGCTDSLEKKNYIHVQLPPLAQFSADTTYSNCYPFIVNFVNESVTNYPGLPIWNFGENSSISNATDPIYIYKRSGDFDVTLVSQTTYGCTDTLIKKGFINVGGPYANFDLPDTICSGDDVLFASTEKLNIFGLNWDFGDGVVGYGDSILHTYDTYGFIYPVLYLKSDNANTCNKVFIDTIYIPEVSALVNKSVTKFEGCVPYRYTPTDSSINAVDWEWFWGDGTSSDGGEENVHTYTIDGSYNMHLIVQNGFGCIDTSEIYEVNVYPLPDINIITDTVMCRDSQILLWAGGGNKYLWSPGTSLDNPNEWNPLASPDSSVIYKVEVTDFHGCLDSSFVEVSVIQPPVYLFKDTTIIIGETIQMNVELPSVETYHWYPENIADCIDCPQISVKPLESSNIILSVTDTSGCFELDYGFYVEVENKTSLDLPSAFTPNGDGTNDIVYIKGWGIKEVLEFRIFNRFGQVIYNGKSINEGWDGKYKGVGQPVDTYQYTVKVMDYNNKILSKSGSIKLLR